MPWGRGGAVGARDRHFALAAVERSGLALRYVSEQLQLEREFVLTAVQLNPGALRYAEERTAIYELCS